MVGLSKIFEWPLNRVHCARILHSLPEQSCTEAFLWNLYRNHVSSAKYYLPLLLLPPLFKWRQMNRKKLLSTFKYYAQATTFASCINALTFYLMCIGRRLYGRYVRILTPYLSCWLASQLTWWMPPRLLQFYGTGITHAALEGLLRQSNARLVQSRSAQTLVFMLCSMVILCQQQAQLYSGFWFIKPDLLPVDYQKLTLSERTKLALKELSKYFGIGLAVDLLNGYLRGKGKPSQLQWKSTSFIVSYIAIYKLIQFLLVGRLTLGHINRLAAFVSGSAFALLNRLTFMAFAVVIATQVIWQRFCACDSRDSKRFQRPLTLLQSIPWAKLLIPCNLAYLVHSLIFQRHVVNGLARAFIDCTCDQNSQRLYKLLMLPDVSTILTTIKTRPITPFLF